MKRDVFISYSSKDQKIVEGLSAYLEQNEIRCFIAYRDIPPGAVWAAKITEAINSCKVMVVVFSEHFNSSHQVDREIEMCANKHKIILPYKIKDVNYEGVKEYYLGNLHHIDAFPNPENCFGELCETIQNCLMIESETSDQKPQPPASIDNVKDPPESDNPKEYVGDWIERSSKESMELMKQFKTVFAEYLGEYDLKYNKVFIGLCKNDTANNFVAFTPQKRDLIVSFAMEKTKGIDNKLKKSGLPQLSYDERLKIYRIKIVENDLNEKRDVLNFLVKTAYENNDIIQKRYWIERSSEESMDLMKRFKSTFVEYIGEYDLKYKKAYIGLSKDGSANNFVYFTPQKNDLVVYFAIDKSEDIDKMLDKSNLLQLAYDEQFRTYKVKIVKKDLTKSRDVLNFLVKTAYENNRHHQKNSGITE